MSKSSQVLDLGRITLLLSFLLDLQKNPEKLEELSTISKLDPCPEIKSGDFDEFFINTRDEFDNPGEQQLKVRHLAKISSEKKDLMISSLKSVVMTPFIVILKVKHSTTMLQMTDTSIFQIVSN